MLKSAQGKDVSKLPLHKQIALGAKPKKPVIKNAANKKSK